MNDRRHQLDELYDLLHELEGRLGGKRRLHSCSGNMGWPKCGVYFFFEGGETREDEKTPRVVRVGTHALRSPASTTLWGRLAQHRGSLGGAMPGGGNHRGSIFRLHVGSALLVRGECLQTLQHTWLDKTASKETRTAEYPLERAVSDYIGAMDFLWVDVPDDPSGSRNDRGVIETGTIALLSNYDRPSIDAASATWLGRDAANVFVQQSGLWNDKHVRDLPGSSVVEVLERYVTRMAQQDPC
jgi:hypothetical protein